MCNKKAYVDFYADGFFFPGFIYYLFCFIYFFIRVL